MTQPPLSRLIQTRQSCRRFGTNDVSNETLLDIVDEARRAPSAWNLQPWRFHILTSKDAREAAYEASFDQDFLRDANGIILVAGDKRIDTFADDVFEDRFQKNYYTAEDKQKSRDTVQSYKEKDSSFITNFLDRQCAIAAYQIHLSAEARGLGSCIVRGFDQDLLTVEIDLKEWEYPAFLVPIGEDNEDRPQTMRINLETLTQIH